MRAWLGDDLHRNTLFGSQWRDGGVAVRRAPSTLGLDEATVWVAHFGSGRGSGPGTAPGTGPPAGAGTAPSVGPGGGPAGLRLTMTPPLAPAGRRTRFTFVLSAAVAGGRRAIPFKLVYFARQRALTDARGRTTIVTRLIRPSRYQAIALSGAARATATVLVVPRR